MLPTKNLLTLIPDLSNRILEFLPPGSLREFPCVSKATFEIFNTANTNHLTKVETLKKSVLDNYNGALKTAINSDDYLAEQLVLNHVKSMPEGVHKGDLPYSEKDEKFYNIGVTYIKTDNIDKALILVKFIQSNIKKNSLLLATGENYIQKNRPDKAFEIFAAMSFYTAQQSLLFNIVKSLLDKE